MIYISPVGFIFVFTVMITSFLGLFTHLGFLMWTMLIVSKVISKFNNNINNNNNNNNNNNMREVRGKDNEDETQPLTGDNAANNNNNINNNINNTVSQGSRQYSTMNIGPHTGFPQVLVYIYIYFTNIAISSWYILLGMLLEILMGITLRFSIVCSSPVTDNSNMLNSNNTESVESNGINNNSVGNININNDFLSVGRSVSSSSSSSSSSSGPSDNNNNINNNNNNNNIRRRNIGHNISNDKAARDYNSVLYTTQQGSDRESIIYTDNNNNNNNNLTSIKSNPYDTLQRFMLTGKYSVPYPIDNNNNNINNNNNNNIITNKPTKKRFTIIIMNHRTRMDWMFAWILLSRTPELLSTLRIVLSSALAKVPGPGWCTQLARFIFLSRKWIDDEEHMRTVIEFLKMSPGEDRVTLYIFPEGTDLSPSNISKSQVYAEKYNLPKFLYVLNPRTTGIVAIKNMIGAENIDIIIDATIGYNDRDPKERPSEKNIFANTLPYSVHFLLERFAFPESCIAQHIHNNNNNNNNNNNIYGIPPPSIIPSDDDGFARFIMSRFCLKETDLSNYYNTGPVDFLESSLASGTYEEVRVVARGEELQGNNNNKEDYNNTLVQPAQRDLKTVILKCFRRVICSTHSNITRGNNNNNINNNSKLPLVIQRYMISVWYGGSPVWRHRIHYGLLPLLLHIIPAYYLIVYHLLWRGIIYGIGWLCILRPVMSVAGVAAANTNTERVCISDFVISIIMMILCFLSILLFMVVIGGDKRFPVERRTFDNVVLYGPCRKASYVK